MVLNYLEKIALSVKEELQLPDKTKFAIFGGVVRDAILSANLGMDIPEFKDVDILLTEKIEIDNNKNIYRWFYNSFGGKKIITNNNIVIEIFSEFIDDFNLFINKQAFNCYQCMYIYPDKELRITNNFSEFIKTKEIKFCCQDSFKMGMGGEKMSAIMNAVKLEQRFGIKVGIESSLKESISCAEDKDAKEIIDYITKKIEKGEFFKKILESYQNIRKNK